MESSAGSRWKGLSLLTRRDLCFVLEVFKVPLGQECHGSECSFWQQLEVRGG